MNVSWIVIRLLHHQWLASFRSVVRPQNIAGTVVLSVVVVILALNLLSLGFFLEGFLAALDPGVDPVGIINNVLLYYILLDLLLRLWFQRIPGQIVRPYLLLPVRRSTLIHLLVSKSLFGLFNFLPLLLFVPVALRVIAPARGGDVAATWTAFLVMVLLVNGMVTLYVKKRELVSPWTGAMVLAILGTVAVLDYIGLFSLREISASLFGMVVDRPWYVVIPFLILCTSYWAIYRLLLEHLTIENLPMTREASGGRTSFRRLEESGATGRLVALELKMLLRNKRPRAVMIFSASMIPLMMAFEAYFLSAMPERSEVYPVPDSLALEQAVLAGVTLSPGLNTRRVTFSLQSQTVPQGTWVYVTGNTPMLGDWDPGAVPLLRQGDGVWRRTVDLPAGRMVEFKFTLGSWDAQRVLADGTRPANSRLFVEQDTTITLAADRWRSPEVFVLINVNIIYIGILLSGMLLLTYGQLLLGWEGGYLEGILTRRVGLSTYLEAKYALLVGSVLVSFLLCLPLALVKPWFAPLSAALALYNAGVNTIVLLMLAQFSKKPVDLSASVFSMQGKGSVQILLIAPVMLGPILIYVFCALLGVDVWAFWLLGGLGMLGLIFHRRLVAAAGCMLLRKKHRIIAAYRMT